MSRDELLQRFDKNRNGRIDGDEMRQVRATVGRRDRDSARAPEVSRQARLDQAEILKRFDLNQDQRLDATERQQALEAMRKKKATD
jgi:Ca2+-binding EF-hand superfamily protein